MDIVVLLLIGGGAVLGTLRGFVMEVLSLFAWVAAILALKVLHAPAAALLVHLVHSPSGASVLAFALVFGLVFFGGKLVAASLGRRTKKSVLGSFDRMLGFGFGALKGLLVATVLFLGVNLVFDTIYGGGSVRPEFIRTSRTYPLLNASGRAVVDWVQRRRMHDATPDNATDATQPSANAQ